jgi:ribosomal protein S18 acetylase RimI-like enzyme
MSQHDNVIIVRRASTADRAAVMALVPRLVEFGPPKWRDIATMTATDVTVIGEALLSASKSPAVYVAKLDGELAGFIHLHSVTDYYRRREHGHVADIVVSERAEGRGVASRLLAEAEVWARKQSFDWLTISVFDENRRAAGLYERIGFRRDIARLVKPLL